MAWFHKTTLAEVMAQSRELKAEARNLRMKLEFLSRIYPLKGTRVDICDNPAPGPTEDDGPDSGEPTRLK